MNMVRRWYLGRGPKAKDGGVDGLVDEGGVRLAQAEVGHFVRLPGHEARLHAFHEIVFFASVGLKERELPLKGLFTLN